MQTRTRFGIGLTFLFLLAAVAYVGVFVGLRQFFNSDIGEVGDFVGGILAPIALLWLVIGYFQQGEELNQNTNALKQQYEELKRAAEQAERQSEAISANEQHARRDTFLRMSDLAVHELSNICKKVCAQLFAKDLMRSINESYASGYKEIYFERIERYYEVGPENFQLFAEKHPEYVKDIDRYLARFTWLLNQAALADPEGNLEELLRHAPVGEACRVFNKVRKYFPGDN